MSRMLSLVAVQFDIVWEDRNANHRRVRELLQSVNVSPGSLIVLPEMFDVGFSMDLKRTAQPETRDTEEFLRELAKTYRSAVLGGVVGCLRSSSSGHDVSSNEAVGFDPLGRELVRYHKMQPFTPPGEDRLYGQGKEPATFVWQGVQISPYICYDLRFPEVFRPTAVAGTELFLVIASWPSMRSEHWVRLLQARAIENQAFVLGLNRRGNDPNFPYAGRSAAFDPQGNCLVEADGREQVLQLTLDADEASRWRETFPALRDMRTRFEFR